MPDEFVVFYEDEQTESFSSLEDSEKYILEKIKDRSTDGESYTIFVALKRAICKTRAKWEDYHG